MTSISAQEPESNDTINGSASTNGSGSVGVPRKFTWRELSKLNEPHNAHVAYRGKVSCRSTLRTNLLTIGELHGRGLVALACEIETYENLFCGLFGQICENLHQRKFPAIRYI